MQVVSLRLSAGVVAFAGVADLLNVLLLWFCYMPDAGSVVALSWSRLMTFCRVACSVDAATHAVTATS